jgi:hypothetical protein
LIQLKNCTPYGAHSGAARSLIGTVINNGFHFIPNMGSTISTIYIILTTSEYITIIKKIFFVKRVRTFY